MSAFECAPITITAVDSLQKPPHDKRLLAGEHRRQAIFLLI